VTVEAESHCSSRTMTRLRTRSNRRCVRCVHGPSWALRDGEARATDRRSASMCKMSHGDPARESKSPPPASGRADLLKDLLIVLCQLAPIGRIWLCSFRVACWVYRCCWSGSLRSEPVGRVQQRTGGRCCPVCPGGCGQRRDDSRFGWPVRALLEICLPPPVHRMPP
jgi:hypothetical protein